MFINNQNFNRILKDSKKFKISVFLSSIFFIVFLFIFYISLQNSNEKIIDLMKDRHIESFNIEFNSTANHYRTLALLVEKEFINEIFLKQVYLVKKSEKLSEIINTLNIQIENKFGAKYFNIDIKKVEDNKINELKGFMTKDGFKFKKSLYYKNNYIGELSMNLIDEDVIKWLVNSYNSHIFMILEKSQLSKEEQKNFSTSSICKDYMYKTNILRYILEHFYIKNQQVNYEQFQIINKSLNLKLKQYKGLQNIKENYVDWAIIDEEKVIAIILHPLMDKYGNNTGFLIKYVEDNEYLKYINISKIIFIVLIGIAILFYLFIIYILYQKEKVSQKNSDLKKVVKELSNARTKISGKQLELIAINCDLEDKIKESVRKEKEKDKILFQQSKLATMGEMIGNIAHQWRQPLSILALQIQDIKDAYAYGEVNQEYIDNLVENSINKIDYMSKTIDDFRNFYVPNKTRIRFDILKSVKEVVDILAISLKNHKIDFVISVYKEKYFSMGYPNEFKQVLLNIINNAKDAFIELEKESGFIDNKKIEIVIKDDHEFNSIIITDNAGGIPSNILDRIFEPYFTTKQEDNGTGLGLYMSKMIIEENMDGILDVYNSEDGAVFIVKLKVDKI